MTRTASETSHDAADLMRSYLQKVATGPEMSQDLSEEEARTAMALILAGKVDPVQAGVFLIALRMKRETDAENIGVLAAIRTTTTTTVAAVEEVLDISEPYDGFLRHLPASPFLPALLAACGLAAVSHGLELVGPKFGVTHRHILRAAGRNVDHTPAEAASRIAAPDVGWAYVDQRNANPALHDLIPLRTLIVKRSCITTVEGLAGPVRGRNRTHLIRGYVHEGYKVIYPVLAHSSGYTSALMIRGIEGGVMPLLNKPVTCCGYDIAGNAFDYTLDPCELGVNAGFRAAPLPHNIAKTTVKDRRPEDTATTIAALADAAAVAGTQALEGRAGPTRDGLVYAAAVCLRHCKRVTSLAEGAAAAREALDSGRALTRFLA
jgi:anthranilate phosphoribosyltransferase